MTLRRSWWRWICTCDRCVWWDSVWEGGGVRDGETMAETRRGDGGGGVRADGAAADVFALFGASDGVCERGGRGARARIAGVRG